MHEVTVSNLKDIIPVSAPGKVEVASYQEGKAFKDEISSLSNWYFLAFLSPSSLGPHLSPPQPTPLCFAHKSSKSKGPSEVTRLIDEYEIIIVPVVNKTE